MQCLVLVKKKVVQLNAPSVDHSHGSGAELLTPSNEPGLTFEHFTAAQLDLIISHARTITTTIMWSKVLRTPRTVEILVRYLLKFFYS